MPTSRHHPRDRFLDCRMHRVRRGRTLRGCMHARMGRDCADVHMERMHRTYWRVINLEVRKERRRICFPKILDALHLSAHCCMTRVQGVLCRRRGGLTGWGSPLRVHSTVSANRRDLASVREAQTFSKRVDYLCVFNLKRASRPFLKPSALHFVCAIAAAGPIAFLGEYDRHQISS